MQYLKKPVDMLIALALAGAVPAATLAATPAEGATATLGEVTVTGTREARAVAETPATVNHVDETTIRQMRPTHPKDVMNQVPGVWVSNLSGEGHSTAIRQPLTTSAVYLYLEDGIPTRSTGFFNHNALYEIDVPQSGGIEVTKGPGSALYGSDAIGGTVNVLTRTPPKDGEVELTGEGGDNGWGRVMVSAGDARGDDAWRASVNLTHSDGWQDAAGYDRQTGTLRWDRAIGDSSVTKTVFSFSTVEQQHVGSLSQAEYESTPRRNNIPFSYRDVDAFRLSTAFERDDGKTLLSVTPYLRKNRMEIIPSWTVSYDPNQYITENDSLGMLGKYRIDFAPMRARLIAGIDIDYSPGSRDEDSLGLLKTTNAESGTTYALNTAVAPVQIYDYDVTYRGISPYLHGEISPLEKLRVTAGLRHDDMQYDYDNQFNNGAAAATQGVAGAFPGGGWYGHAASTRISYSHLSPKLGATWAFSDDVDAFVSYTNAFRTPSEGQVFRGSREGNAIRAQAAADSLLQLKPVVVDSIETGLRAKQGSVRYEVSIYRMVKKDDIVSYTDPVTSQRTVVNAGKTHHQGVEAGVGLPLVTDRLRLDASLSWAEHTYDTWVVSGTTDYSGKEMESAPNLIANTRLTMTPGFMNGGRVQLEWVRLGEYWRDQANTGKYSGHNLVNVSAVRPVGKTLEIYGSINNLLDKKYAETAGLSAGAPTWDIGLPLSLKAGVQASW